MQITRNTTDTVTGPSEWFTGVVFVDPLAAPSDGSRASVSNVHFAPRARTAWHAHPHGQTIWVTQGIGLVQVRGEPVEVDADGNPAMWGEHVNDDEYAAAAQTGADPQTPGNAR